MRSHRWIVVAAVLLSALIGVAIAGIPHHQPPLDLRPPVSSTTTLGVAPAGPTTTTTP